MNCILSVRSEIGIKFGGRRFAASHFRGLWQARDKGREVFAKCEGKLSKITEAKMKERSFIGAPKLNNYSRTKILVQN